MKAEEIYQEKNVVLEGMTTNDGGSGVTVVFSGTDDDILVSPVF